MQNSVMFRFASSAYVCTPHFADEAVIALSAAAEGAVDSAGGYGCSESESA